MKVLLGHQPGKVAKKYLASIGRRRGWWVNLLWEPRDLWLGVYWTRVEGVCWDTAIDVYITIVPCLPIRIQYRSNFPLDDSRRNRWSEGHRDHVHYSGGGR